MLFHLHCGASPLAFSAQQLASKSNPSVEYHQLLMYIIIIIIAMIRFPHFLFYYCCFPSRRGKAKSHLSSEEKVHGEALKRNLSHLIQSFLPCCEQGCQRAANSAPKSCSSFMTVAQRVEKVQVERFLSDPKALGLIDSSSLVAALQISLCLFE